MTLRILNTDIDPVSEHGGTVTSWFMYPKETLRDATDGSYLEFVNEFQLEPGVAIEPHRHNSHEFYYVLRGGGMMRVDDEEREMVPGDLVHIGPGEAHSLRAGEEGVRCFAFAVSFMKPGESYSVADLEGWEH
ncbi:MAG: cupin domain-containing protein [Actinomycetales bacterium]|nr:cupin domain-containing protein [Actinomycetales bacterium]